MTRLVLPTMTLPLPRPMTARNRLVRSSFVLAAFLTMVAKLHLFADQFVTLASLAGAGSAVRVGVQSLPLASLTSSTSRSSLWQGRLTRCDMSCALESTRVLSSLLAPMVLTLGLVPLSHPTWPRVGTAGANDVDADADDVWVWLAPLVPLALVFCRSGLAAAFRLGVGCCSCMRILGFF